MPPERRARLERVMRWRPETYDVWWNTPVVRYDWRRPCELDAWQLEEFVGKLEDSAAFEKAHWLAQRDAAER